MWRIGLLIIGAYTALFLINVPQAFYFNAQSEQPVNIWALALRGAWGMYSWVLVTPIILWTGYRFRLARANLLRNISIHLSVGIITGVLRSVIYHLILPVLGVSLWETVFADLAKTATYIQAVTGALISYPSVIAIQQAYLYFRESQDRAYRLQEAELQMLKMQLQPHFFFNTLNAISALMYRSPKEADRMISQLGEMFRIALRKDKTQEVTLKEEVEFLRAFLQIHQTLMGERLKVNWEIKPETLDALVPNLILQPLAENAIQHGIAPLENGGLITICAQRQNGSLLLQVSDDGLGLTTAKENKNGVVGLSNTRARLESLYNGGHKFSITERTKGGAEVNIKIPFRQRSEIEMQSKKVF